MWHKNWTIIWCCFAYLKHCAWPMISQTTTGRFLSTCTSCNRQFSIEARARTLKWRVFSPSNLCDVCSSVLKNRTLEFRLRYMYFGYRSIVFRSLSAAIEEYILCAYVKNEIFTNFKLICTLLMQEGAPLITRRPQHIFNLIRHLNLRLTIYKYHLLQWVRMLALQYIIQKNEGKHGLGNFCLIPVNSCQFVYFNIKYFTSSILIYF